MSTHRDKLLKYVNGISHGPDHTTYSRNTTTGVYEGTMMWERERSVTIMIKFYYEPNSKTEEFLTEIGLMDNESDFYMTLVPLSEVHRTFSKKFYHSAKTWMEKACYINPPKISDEEHFCNLLLD